jgi:sucrose phosphorylase
MVYNFTLPPLLFYTLVKGDASVLTQWAAGLELPSETNTFFNFTASHDGIGVRPLEGILPAEALDELIQVVEANGGRVSYKHNSDGSKSPYELNITYVDALLPGGHQDDPLQAERFLASQAIQYSLPGVPATYIHSLLGSRNWEDGVRQTGRARSINREKLLVEEVEAELKNPASLRSRIFWAYLDMIRVRIKQPAFHPKAGFKVLDIGSRVFAIARSGSGQTLYALTNVTSEDLVVALPENESAFKLKDVIGGQDFNPEAIRLKPYQYVWLHAPTE